MKKWETSLKNLFQVLALELKTSEHLCHLYCYHSFFLLRQNELKIVVEASLNFRNAHRCVWCLTCGNLFNWLKLNSKTVLKKWRTSLDHSKLLYSNDHFNWSIIFKLVIVVNQRLVSFILLWPAKPSFLYNVIHKVLFCFQRGARMGFSFKPLF